MADDSSFASLMESKDARSGTRRLRAGDVIEATVIQISEDSVFVDVGTPSDGRIARSELADPNGELRLKVGDVVKATVVDPRPDGPVLAVAFGGRAGLDTTQLELAHSTGTPVEGEVTKVNKGGVEVMVGSLRAFCPASQLELGHVADLSVFVGQKLEFRVLEVRDGGRSVVLSRRALLEDRRREAAASAKDRLIAGEDADAVVTSLGKHGAVVDLDGVEGFIHVSELAAHRVARAEDVVRVGERVRARILSVDDGPKGLRVRLSLRALAAADNAAVAGSPENAPPPDEILTGTVTRTAQHGVYVQTTRGEGMIPIRELGLAPGADHRRAFPAGKTLQVVLVNRAGGRLTFSSTQVARVEERKNYREFTSAGGAPAAPSSFGSLGDALRQKFGASLPAAEASPSPVPAKPASDEAAKAPVQAKPASAEAPKAAAPAPAPSPPAREGSPEWKSGVVRRRP